MKTRIANIEIENEEVELKNESLKITIASVDDRLEAEYKESRKFKEAFNDLQIINANQNDELQEKFDDILGYKDTLEEIKTAKKTVEKRLKQSEEDNLMLENRLESKCIKVSELEDLVSKKSYCEKCENICVANEYLNSQNEDMHVEESVPTTSKCGSCEYESEDEIDMNEHIKSKHVIKCKICDLEFESEMKMKKHMCRVHVSNPTCGDFYTKNWIIANGCTRIYSKSKEIEVLFLHSKQCLSKQSSCPDLYASYDMTNYDGEAYHAPLEDFFSDNKINWEELNWNFIRI